MENLTKKSVRFGEIILFIARLQLYWFASVFRLGILTGIFPSTATVIDYLFKSFKDLDDASLLKNRNFIEASKTHFKPANILGFVTLMIGLLLYIDWRISLVFINNWFFQFLLFLLTMVVATTLIYVLPCYVRYTMPLKAYFKQAFFLMLCNIPSSIAIFLGSLLMVVVFLTFPIVTIAPVPLALLPTAWFSYLAMQRLEKQLASE